MEDKVSQFDNMLLAFKTQPKSTKTFSIKPKHNFPVIIVPYLELWQYLMG